MQQPFGPRARRYSTSRWAPQRSSTTTPANSAKAWALQHHQGASQRRLKESPTDLRSAAELENEGPFRIDLGVLDHAFSSRLGGEEEEEKEKMAN
ncbi:hypothetical protein TIFTF001_029503 [Ficus carica]|uniref:Uncharacterized protein n=1 Tax=Ficus carica TaxID=3494 RepID=A0AA88DRV3_FICCA|nr:hypothetical protein TIFTF001_029503 [Ficus carica]